MAEGAVCSRALLRSYSSKDLKDKEVRELVMQTPGEACSRHREQLV